MVGRWMVDNGAVMVEDEEEDDMEVENDDDDDDEVWGTDCMDVEGGSEGVKFPTVSNIQVELKRRFAVLSSTMDAGVVGTLRKVKGESVGTLLRSLGDDERYLGKVLMCYLHPLLYGDVARAGGNDATAMVRTIEERSDGKSNI